MKSSQDKKGTAGHNPSRRSFFQVVAGLTGLALLAPKSLKGLGTVAQAEEKRRGGSPAGGGDADLPLAEPGKDVAGGMNYQHKHADVKDAKLKTERQGVAWEKQLCSGCSFYTAAGKKGADEVGKCTIIPGKVVKAAGWCASWNKKA